MNFPDAEDVRCALNRSDAVQTDQEFCPRPRCAVLTSEAISGFGVRLDHHKLPLPHSRCKARIPQVHSITDDQLPDLSAPRIVPEALDINQLIAPDAEKEPGVN